MLEEFGKVVAPGGAGVVIASQSGHRLPALTAAQDRALATAPVDDLLSLPMLHPDRVTDPLNAYQLSKRANVLRVMAQAVVWGRRRASQGHHPGHHHHASGARRADRAEG